MLYRVLRNIRLYVQAGRPRARRLQHTQERAQFEETQVGGMAPPPTHTFADGLSFSRFEVIHLCVHQQY